VDGDQALLHDVSVDALLRGAIKLVQPRRGFRASLDPVLLAGFVGAASGRFLDIGCGTGAVSFLLLARSPALTGVGVEIQSRLAACVSAGVSLNAWESRFEVVTGEVKAWAETVAPGGFDLVVTNPPFRKGSPPSPHPERAHAHHEGSLSLEAWADVAARLVRPEGRVAAIFAAERKDELFEALTARGLAARRWRWVAPRLGAPSSRVLVEARPWVHAGVSPGAREEPPLVVHEGAGYSAEVAAWLEPGVFT